MSTAVSKYKKSSSQLLNKNFDYSNNVNNCGASGGAGGASSGSVNNVSNNNNYNVLRKN